MAEIHFANDFNFHDQFGRTPLYIAVINKNIECIRELIKIGADVNAKCENGNTCLHRMMLCKDGDPKTEQIIQMLLTNGQITKKELQTHKAYTDLHDLDYDMLMTKNTANIKTLNDMNKTALYYASKARKERFGWNSEVGNVLSYDQIAYGDNKTRQDREMKQM